MRRMSLFLVALLVPFMATLAQARDLKEWDEGALSWNDFHGASVMKGVPSSIKVVLTTTPLEGVSGKKLQYKIVANAVMDRNQSFADSSARTEQRLRYHQLQFDQLELFRRRLQSDLNSGMNGIEADNKLKYYQNLYKDQINTIKEETEDGSNENKLQEWEYYTRKGLEAIGLPPVPEFEPSDWCYGVYLGVGGVFPNSEVDDYFASCFTFTAGLTGGYKRLKLKADIGYGQPKFNTRNVFGVKDDKGRDKQGPMNEYATYMGVSTTLGYSVINTKRFAVTPHVGLYWGSYSWNMANLKYVYDEELGKDVSKVASTADAKLKDFSWMAGVDFDVRIHKYVSSTPFFLTGRREQLSSSIRITPYVARVAFNEIGARGYHVGITVSYAGIARSLKMK